PVKIPLPSTAKSIAAGSGHSCAVSTDGTAYCWGDGLGELGDGASPTAHRQLKTPQAVATSVKFTQISAGTTQTCAVADTQDAYCWGGSYGTLGVGAKDTACPGSD